MTELYRVGDLHCTCGLRYNGVATVVLECRSYVPNRCTAEVPLLSTTDTRAQPRPSLRTICHHRKVKPPSPPPRVVIPKPPAPLPRVVITKPPDKPIPASPEEPIAQCKRSHNPPTVDTAPVARRTCSQNANTASVITPSQAAQRRYPRKFLQSLAMPVLDETSGQSLKYRKLRKHPKFARIWNTSSMPTNLDGSAKVLEKVLKRRRRTA